MTDVEPLQQAIERNDLEFLGNQFEAASVELPSIIWQPSDNELPAAELQLIHRYWRDLKGKRDLPLVREIDASDFWSIVGFVVLQDPVDGGRDFRVRLFGSYVADLAGIDMTGKLMSELPLPLFHRSFMIACLRAVVRLQRPLMTILAIPPQSNVARWTRLILPFAGDDGSVGRLLVLCLPGELRELAPELRERFYRNVLR